MSALPVPCKLYAVGFCFISHIRNNDFLLHQVMEFASICQQDDLITGLQLVEIPEYLPRHIVMPVENNIPAAARVARSGWSPGGGGPAAVGVVVMF